jgi:hypothetical protein
MGMWRLGFGLLYLAPWGCGEGLPHPPYAAHVTADLTAIDFGPPPGRVELAPKRPVGADAWVDGEWVRRHGRWYWFLGRWVRTPAGASYSPWVVVRASDGTSFYAPSRWHDAKGVPIPPPPALAYAKANGQAVFDAEGETEQVGRSIKVLPAEREIPDEDAGR